VFRFPCAGLKWMGGPPPISSEAMFCTQSWRTLQSAGEVEKTLAPPTNPRLFQSLTHDTRFGQPRLSGMILKPPIEFV
jgi:hypothetical protein